jgi:hypothetical protein
MFWILRLLVRTVTAAVKNWNVMCEVIAEFIWVYMYQTYSQIKVDMNRVGALLLAYMLGWAGNVAEKAEKRNAYKVFRLKSEKVMGRYRT